MTPHVQLRTRGSARPDSGADSRAGRPPAPAGAGRSELLSALRRLTAAECAAEAPGAGTEPEDLEQSVWLRWLEDPGSRSGTAPPSAGWLRSAVRAEARRLRRRTRREVPLPAHVLADRDAGSASPQAADATVLAAEHSRVLAAAVARLPGRCPGLMRALMSRQDLTYPEIARELGMSQGSLGPVRSRCLGCLRTMLTASDCVT